MRYTTPRLLSGNGSAAAWSAAAKFKLVSLATIPGAQIYQNVSGQFNDADYVRLSPSGQLFGQLVSQQTTYSIDLTAGSLTATISHTYPVALLNASTGYLYVSVPTAQGAFNQATITPNGSVLSTFYSNATSSYWISTTSGDNTYMQAGLFSNIYSVSVSGPLGGVQYLSAFNTSNSSVVQSQGTPVFPTLFFGLRSITYANAVAGRLYATSKINFVGPYGIGYWDTATLTTFTIVITFGSVREYHFAAIGGDGQVYYIDQPALTYLYKYTPDGVFTSQSASIDSATQSQTINDCVSTCVVTSSNRMWVYLNKLNQHGRDRNNALVMLFNTDTMTMIDYMYTKYAMVPETPFQGKAVMFLPNVDPLQVYTLEEL